MKRRGFLGALATAVALAAGVARSASVVAPPVLFGQDPRAVLGAITTPVTFTWSFAMTTGTTFNPLTDWQYETPDFAGMIEVFSRATAVGLLETISSAGETLKQESPVQAGGTAGTIPSRLNTEPVVGRAAPLQKIRVFYRNPTGGTITIDGQIVLTPLGGGGARRGAARKGGRRGR